MKKEKVGTINMMELMLNQRKFTTSEISRGTYIGKSKKGKGSYNRKQKYKKNYTKDDGSFLCIKKELTLFYLNNFLASSRNAVNPVNTF